MKNWFLHPTKKTVLIVTAIWLLSFGCILIASDFFKRMNLPVVMLLVISFFSVVDIFSRYMKAKKRA